MIAGLAVVKHEETPRGVLEAALKDVDQFSGVVVLSIHTDGGQSLETSRMNHHEKCFLGTFYMAWLQSWFAMMEKQ